MGAGLFPFPLAFIDPLSRLVSKRAIEFACAILSSNGVAGSIEGANTVGTEAIGGAFASSVPVTARTSEEAMVLEDRRCPNKNRYLSYPRSGSDRRRL